MAKGFVILVLHAHLPFIRHPEDEGLLEERWFFEALTECYLPLLSLLEGLRRDGIPSGLTLSFSPTLLAMLADDWVRGRYRRYLHKLLRLAEREAARTRGDDRFAPVVAMYRDRLLALEQLYNRHHGRLVEAFGRLQEARQIEIITCAATHGFLPVLGVQPEAVEAQVRVGLQAYREHFGRDPGGFWLPECGYSPGLDRVLARHGIRYFLAESHGLLYARPAPRYAVYAPARTPAGVQVLARDPESSRQVWSAREGYPGDYYYREFYRDIGYDLDYGYIRPHLHYQGIRADTGFKYYRITGPTVHKEPYDREAALATADRHAANFMFNRERQIEYLAAAMDRPPVVVAPYDAELFGHWWFEGPEWLDLVIRKSRHDQNVFDLITPGEYLRRYPAAEVLAPNPSSWGEGGYSGVWLDGANHWLYRHLYHGLRRMAQLAAEHPRAQGALRRALNQAARELLLAQASDWPFIMKTGTTVEYATRRFLSHLGRFTRLYEEIRGADLDLSWLGSVEKVDNIFPGLDYHVFAEGGAPPA